MLLGLNAEEGVSIHSFLHHWARLRWCLLWPCTVRGGVYSVSVFSMYRISVFNVHYKLINQRTCSVHLGNTLSKSWCFAFSVVAYHTREGVHLWHCFTAFVCMLWIHLHTVSTAFSVIWQDPRHAEKCTRNAANFDLVWLIWLMRFSCHLWHNVAIA